MLQILLKKNHLTLFPSQYHTLFSARRYFWPGVGWLLLLRAQGFKIWNMINNPLVEWLLVIVPHPKPHVCATVGVICG